MTEEWKDFESCPAADLAQELAEFMAWLFLEQGRKTNKFSFLLENAKKFWENAIAHGVKPSRGPVILSFGIR